MVSEKSDQSFGKSQTSSIILDVMATAKKSKKAMSDQHKAALAEGRNEGRVVREYLEAIRSNKGRPGRKRTPDSVARRLKAIEVELRAASPVRELELVQERLDLSQELERMNSKVDPATIEAKFAKVASGYSQRKGISYAAWRAVGVEPTVLKKAGIGRGS